MYRRIFFVVLFALSAFALTLRVEQEGDPIVEQETDPIVERCAKAHPVSDNIKFARHDKISTSDLSNSTTGCFIACVWEATGQLLADGTVNSTYIPHTFANNLAHHQEVTQAFRDCYGKRGENKCETVSKVMVCIYEDEEIRNMHPIGSPHPNRSQ